MIDLRRRLAPCVWAAKRLWFRAFSPRPSLHRVGDRVHVEGEGVGHIEAVESWHDGGMGWRYEVRWLTPNNEPSCCLTFGIAEARVKQVPESVLPQPRSAAWKRESEEFYGAIDLGD